MEEEPSNESTDSKGKDYEEQFKTLFVHAPDPIIIADIDSGIILDANEAAGKMMLMPREKLLGLHQSQLHAFDTTAGRETFKTYSHAMQQSELPAPIEFDVIRSDGMKVPVEILASIVNMKGKKCLLGVFRDITKRKKAESAEKERIKELIFLFKLTEVFNNYLNPLETIFEQTVQLIPSAMQYPDIAYARINYHGKDYKTSIYTPTELIIGKEINSGEENPGAVEIGYLKSTVENRPVEFLMEEQMLLSEIVTRLRKLIHKRKTEQALAESEAHLRELNATKDKFFSIIAHDLRSPFNAILGFSEMLKSNAGQLDCRSTENYASIINSTAKKAYELLENLLEWAAIQRGEIPFNPKPLLLEQVTLKTIQGLQYNADQKNIELISNIGSNIILSADENMLGTILRNLISNAIKFTPKNGMINVTADVGDTDVEISVSDNGVGMTGGDIKKLFNIETSFSTNGTDKEKGSGLGLILCEEFVRKHGGKIRVKSEAGKGSIFTFSIPKTVESGSLA